MCQKNQACTGVESRNIIFIYGATIINERTLSKKKKIRLVRELNHGISKKKKKVCTGIDV